MAGWDVKGGLVNTESKNFLLMHSIRSALSFLKDRVLVAPPLKLVPASLQCWKAFTGGAAEGDVEKVGGIGVFLLSP